MQHFLFLLVLMGESCLVTPEFYTYTFVSTEESWVEAQKYCQSKHTDLATILDHTDLTRLQVMLPDSSKEAWIGLNAPRTNPDNKVWMWSQPGLEKPDWKTQDQGDCATVKSSVAEVNPAPCSDNHKLICYNETNKIEVIDQELSWIQAQRYCRANYIDLFSGQQQLSQLKCNGTINDENDEYWIGLFRDNWKWSDGSGFSYRSWNNDSSGSGCSVVSAKNMMRVEDCTERRPFFCYNNNLVLIKTKRDWQEAHDDCRENYVDLVAITHQRQQFWLQEMAKNATSDFIWLGLRYTCTLGFWFWLNGEGLDFHNWVRDPDPYECNSGVAMKKADYKWYQKDDEKYKFNYICVR